MLLNGSHGQVFTTGFQPVFRIPFLGEATACLVDYLVRKPWLLSQARKNVILPWLSLTVPLYTRIFGSKVRAATLKTPPEPNL